MHVTPVLMITFMHRLIKLIRDASVYTSYHLHTKWAIFTYTEITLHGASVRSHHDDSSEIWSPRSDLYDKVSGGVQRRATRVLLSKLSYNEQLKRLDPLPLVYQREVRDLVTFYRVKCGHYDCSLDFHFQFCSDMILIKVILK